MTLHVDNPDNIPEAEVSEYVRRAEDMKKAGALPEGVDRISLRLAEDGNVDVRYFAPGRKFERIRRITGYLVGTLDRFNDAKRAEERDRVKHGMGASNAD